MYLPYLTAEDAASALRAAGFPIAPGALNVEHREDRWLVRLVGNRLAWVAASPAGVERLAAEGVVLRAVELRCAFSAPRVLFANADGGVQVRSMVEGIADAPRAMYERAIVDAPFARAIGTQVARILAEQHLRVRADDVPDLRRRVPWPEPVPELRQLLPLVLQDVNGGDELLADLVELFDRFEAVQVADADRVLVHGDVGFHNLVLDSAGSEVTGIFDYDGAAWDDHHLDFRYLLFAIDHDEMLEAATTTYEVLTGLHLDPDRVVLYNAMAAAGYLANRQGVAADVVWCGRTLVDDLRWTRAAVRRVLGGGG